MAAGREGAAEKRERFVAIEARAVDRVLQVDLTHTLADWSLRFFSRALSL